jgi:hypothetical protein
MSRWSASTDVTTAAAGAASGTSGRTRRPPPRRARRAGAQAAAPRLHAAADHARRVHARRVQDRRRRRRRRRLAVRAGNGEHGAPVHDRAERLCPLEHRDATRRAATSGCVWRDGRRHRRGRRGRDVRRVVALVDRGAAARAARRRRARPQVAARDLPPPRTSSSASVDMPAPAMPMKWTGPRRASARRSTLIQSASLRHAASAISGAGARRSRAPHRGARAPARPLPSAHALVVAGQRQHLLPQPLRRQVLLRSMMAAPASPARGRCASGGRPPPWAAAPAAWDVPTPAVRPSPWRRRATPPRPRRRALPASRRCSRTLHPLQPERRQPRAPRRCASGPSPTGSPAAPAAAAGRRGDLLQRAEQRLVHRARALAAAHHQQHHRVLATGRSARALARVDACCPAAGSGCPATGPPCAPPGFSCAPPPGTRGAPAAPSGQHARREARVRVLLLHRHRHARQHGPHARRSARVAARADDEDGPQPAEQLRQPRTCRPAQAAAASSPHAVALEAADRQQRVLHALLRQHARFHAAPRADVVHADRPDPAPAARRPARVPDRGVRPCRRRRRSRLHSCASPERRAMLMRMPTPPGRRAGSSGRTT